VWFWVRCKFRARLKVSVRFGFPVMVTECWDSNF